METYDEPHPENTSAHTARAESNKPSTHKQQHGRRMLRATFYTIQRRYASYCLVPSCLAGTRPESCTNTLGELQVISLPALASSAEPLGLRRFREAQLARQRCPACAGAFPARAAFPRQPELAHPFPPWLRLREEQAGCCLAQGRAVKGHRANLHAAARCLPCLCRAWVLSRPQEGLALVNPIIS